VHGMMCDVYASILDEVDESKSLSLLVLIKLNIDTYPIIIPLCAYILNCTAVIECVIHIII